MKNKHLFWVILPLLYAISLTTYAQESSSPSPVEESSPVEPANDQPVDAEESSSSTSQSEASEENDEEFEEYEDEKFEEQASSDSVILQEEEFISPESSDETSIVDEEEEATAGSSATEVTEEKDNGEENKEDKENNEEETSSSSSASESSTSEDNQTTKPSSKEKSEEKTQPEDDEQVVEKPADQQSPSQETQSVNQTTDSENKQEDEAITDENEKTDENNQKDNATSDEKSDEKSEFNKGKSKDESVVDDQETDDSDGVESQSEKATDDPAAETSQTQESNTKSEESTDAEAITKEELVVFHVEHQAQTGPSQIVIIDIRDHYDPLLSRQTLTVNTPLNGKVADNRDGTLIYLPNPDFVGVDTFTYTITDDQGNEFVAMVKVEVDRAQLSKPMAADCQMYVIHDEEIRDSQILIIDPTQKQQKTAIPLGPVYRGLDIEGMAIEPTARILYAVSGIGAVPSRRHFANPFDGYLYWVHPQTGDLIAIGHTGFKEITALAFHPDGTLWAWSDGDEAGVIQIDPTTANSQLLFPSHLPRKRKVEGLAWSTDGTLLYASEDTNLWVFDGKKFTKQCQNFPGEVEALETSADGMLLFAIHEHDGNTIYVYDPNQCQVVLDRSFRTLEHYQDVEAIAWPLRCQSMVEEVPTWGISFDGDNADESMEPAPKATLEKAGSKNNQSATDETSEADESTDESVNDGQEKMVDSEESSEIEEAMVPKIDFTEVVCSEDSTWIKVTGEITLDPPDGQVFLGTAWEMVSPTDGRCPPTNKQAQLTEQGNNCRLVSFPLQLVTGSKTSFTIKGWWPGFTDDTAKEDDKSDNQEKEEKSAAKDKSTRKASNKNDEETIEEATDAKSENQVETRYIVQVFDIERNLLSTERLRKTLIGSPTLCGAPSTEIVEIEEEEKAEETEECFDENGKPIKGDKKNKNQTCSVVAEEATCLDQDGKPLSDKECQSATKDEDTICVDKKGKPLDQEECLIAVAKSSQEEAVPQAALDSKALRQFFRQLGADKVVIDKEGHLSIVIGGKVYQGFLSYPIPLESKENADEITLTPVGDNNDDGYDDFVITYADGNIQMLFYLGEEGSQETQVAEEYSAADATQCLDAKGKPKKDCSTADLETVEETEEPDLAEIASEILEQAGANPQAALDTKAVRDFFKEMGAELVKIDKEGNISVSINDQLYQGFLSYPLPLDAASTGEVTMIPVEDVNEDGYDDFAITYPNGEVQMLFFQGLKEETTLLDEEQADESVEKSGETGKKEGKDDQSLSNDNKSSSQETDSAKDEVKLDAKDDKSSFKDEIDSAKDDVKADAKDDKSSFKDEIDSAKDDVKADAKDDKSSSKDNSSKDEKISAKNDAKSDAEDDKSLSKDDEKNSAKDDTKSDAKDDKSSSKDDNKNLVKDDAKSNAKDSFQNESKNSAKDDVKSDDQDQKKSDSSKDDNSLVNNNQSDNKQTTASSEKNEPIDKANQEANNKTADKNSDDNQFSNSAKND
jgi:hypothetical protein